MAKKPKAIEIGRTQLQQLGKAHSQIVKGIGQAIAAKGKRPKKQGPVHLDHTMHTEAGVG